jgi:hypothetical protein
MGRDYCSHIKKITERGFDKTFLLGTDNGCEVIARISTPIAGPSRYATASEVTTINFLRNILQIPIPRILDYSASLKTPIGTEYIITERAHGESLVPGWLSLN